MNISDTGKFKSFIQKKLRKDAPRWFVLSIDLYITMGTFMFTILILEFLGVRMSFPFWEMVVSQSPIAFILALTAFLITASYKGVIRYTGLRDLFNVLKANFLYAVLLSLSSLSVHNAFGDSVFRIKGSVILVHFLINTLVLSLLRVLYKAFYYYYVKGTIYKKKVMIYGAGSSGSITYNALINNGSAKTLVYGFIDDNSRKWRTRICGAPVFNPGQITADFIKKHAIEEIIISIQRLPPARLQEMVDQFSNAAVQLKIVPSIDKWLNGNLTVGQIKQLRIEDLLGRDPISLNNSEINKEVHNKIIMVTGAAGSIGSEISRQLMSCRCRQLILVDQAESALFELQQTTNHHEICEFIIGDIRNYEKMELLMQTYRPDMIFHAAAYKHVPLMESFPNEAIFTNVKGTKNMADLAVKYQVQKFVMVSTDKAVNPTNVMGASKRLAELYVTNLNEKANTRFIVTRFGNVLGSNGSVIPIFKRQLEAGGPLTVTDAEITRYFMTIPEACQLVLEAGTMGKGGEIFVFDMGSPVKIFDLAKKVIRLSGLRYPEDIDIRIIGLRPGEKIYEELLADGEMTLPTHHPKIMIAKVKPIPANFEKKLDRLLKVCPSDRVGTFCEELVSQIKEILPEYISNNSVYNLIDKRLKAV